MKRSIQTPISEMEGKLNGYAVLLNYHYMNLCVKAEPASFLPIIVKNEYGEDVNFEEVANAMFIDKFTFEIVPNNQKLLYNICKSLKMAHPEFKQEIIKADEENMISDDPNEEEMHIICRMPEVNDDRRDVLMDGVKVLYDQCKAEVDKIKASYTAQIAEKCIGLPAEEAEEAKNALEDRFNQYMQYINDYRTNKEKEIEEAYQRWLNERSEQSRQRQEDDATHGNDKAHAYNMYDDE